MYHNMTHVQSSHIIVHLHCPTNEISGSLTRSCKFVHMSQHRNYLNEIEIELVNRQEQWKVSWEPPHHLWCLCCT